MSDIVRVSVGGRKFVTSTTTLTKYGNNLITLLLQHKNKGTMDVAMDDGHIFIDRNGDIFAVILDYLRHGELDTRHYSNHEIQRELDFFQIPHPITHSELFPLIDSCKVVILLF